MCMQTMQTRGQASERGVVKVSVCAQYSFFHFFSFFFSSPERILFCFCYLQYSHLSRRGIALGYTYSLSQQPRTHTHEHMPQNTIYTQGECTVLLEIRWNRSTYAEVDRKVGTRQWRTPTTACDQPANMTYLSCLDGNLWMWTICVHCKLFECRSSAVRWQWVCVCSVYVGQNAVGFVPFYEF